MSRLLLWLALAAAPAAAMTGCIGGIVGVDNTDPGIKARLIHALKGNPDVRLDKVDIDVHVGVVSITGLVGSWEERDAIVRTANRVHGVRQVLANLVVQQ